MNRPPQLLLTISEADFQQVVIDYARLRQWKVVHFRPAQTRNGRFGTQLQGDPGSPDLLLARNGVVLLAELKRHGQHPRPAQVSWLTALGNHGRLWTPLDWNEGRVTDDLNNLTLLEKR